MFTALQACRRRFLLLDMHLLKKVCFCYVLSIFGQYFVNIDQIVGCEWFILISYELPRFTISLISRIVVIPLIPVVPRARKWAQGRPIELFHPPQSSNPTLAGFISYISQYVYE